jgi:ABC-type lipoprotein release transport system permease subunit
MAWSLVASGLGVVNHPIVEPVAVALVVVVAAVLANLSAGGPGWAASRVRPAAVLRSE